MAALTQACGVVPLTCIIVVTGFAIRRMSSMDPSQLLHAHSNRSGEDLLFDLDDERHGHGLSMLSSMTAEPTTPSAGQVKTIASGCRKAHCECPC